MHRSPRISRAEAESLLGGGTSGPPELVALLRAATSTSPASAAELAGEAQALMALRAAHPVPVHPRKRTRMIKSALAQLVAAKIAATAAVAAAATGGVVLAAASGSLPGPLQDAAHSAFGAPEPGHAQHSHPVPNATTTSDTAGPSAPSDSESDQPTVQPSTTPSAAATPNPSLAGLCKAYQAGVANSRGKALDNPAFTVLITAAGGKDNVLTYCAAHAAPGTSGSAAAIATKTHGRPNASTHGNAQPGSQSTHGNGRPGSASTHGNGQPGSQSTHGNAQPGSQSTHGNGRP